MRGRPNRRRYRPAYRWVALARGAIELGPDGHFRNITINNNRTSETRIPVSEASFLAIRVAAGNRVYTRVLQQELEPRVGIDTFTTPRLDPGMLVYRGLYPRVDYRLKDYNCTAEVVWSAFAPVIPFDYEASTLPALLAGCQVGNPTRDILDITVVFNWENLCGRTACRTPGECAPVVPALIEDRDKPVVLRQDAQDTADAGASLVAYNAVEFGAPSGAADNADGHYCLAVKPQDNLDVAAVPWDHTDPDENRAFWQRFRASGMLTAEISHSETKRSGALSCSFQLTPGASRRLEFVLAWYCPRFDVNGVDQGNGYTIRFKSASEVALAGLKNLSYYFSSVQSWQQRILSSSLPSWLQSMLINSASVFSTNAVYSKTGLFGLMESPAEPAAGRGERRLYRSLGTLLFFPRFEGAHLVHWADLTGAVSGGRLCQSLGYGSLVEPDVEEVAGLQLDLCSQFVLSVYSYFAFTGDLPRFETLFRHARRLMADCLRKDRDRDGLPEVDVVSTTYDGISTRGLNSYTCSFWLAALRAYARLARIRNQTEEAKNYERVLKLAVRSFERLFWDEAAGYYRLHAQVASREDLAQDSPNGHPFHDGLGQKGPEGQDTKPCEEDTNLTDSSTEDLTAPVCHSGQLAGQWYADFLGLGPLLPRAHVDRALRTIHQRNERAHGFASAADAPGQVGGGESRGGLEWPGYDGAHYACLQLYHNQGARGIHVLERHAQRLEAHGLEFSHPSTWDPDANEAPATATWRHSAALSIWYALFALQGFELNVAERRLRVTPNLPEGVNKLSAPLFTPACLGWLNYLEHTGAKYLQRLQMSFDSPVTIHTIELRVPAGKHHVSVRCEIPDGPVAVRHTLGRAEGALRLIISPHRPLIASSGLTIEIV